MTHRLTTDRQEVLLRWAAERTGIDSWSADSEAMGVLDAEGRIRAAGVINHVADRQCWIHIASDGRRDWATPTVLGVMFSYPFYMLDLLRVTARVDIDNIAAQVLCLKLGFRVDGRERGGFFGRDVAVFGMMRHECQWIVPDHEEAV